MVTLAKALVKLPNVQFTGIQCYQGYAPGMLNKNCLRSGKTYCGCLGINWLSKVTSKICAIGNRWNQHIRKAHDRKQAVDLVVQKTKETLQARIRYLSVVQ